jgi:hypothetical protein
MHADTLIQIQHTTKDFLFVLCTNDARSFAMSQSLIMSRPVDFQGVRIPYSHSPRRVMFSGTLLLSYLPSEACSLSSFCSSQPLFLLQLPALISYIIALESVGWVGDEDGSWDGLLECALKVTRSSLWRWFEEWDDSLCE